MRAQVYPNLWPGPSLGPVLAAEPAKGKEMEICGPYCQWPDCGCARPPRPTQGDVELWEPIRQVLLGRKEDTTAYHEFCAALRQHADEATRAEREALAEYFEQFGKWYSGPEIAAAIRARITPKGQP